MLWQNYFCSQSRAVRTMVAFSNAIEPIAGGDDPGIGGGALQVLAEIFENGRMFGGKGSKIVDRFVDTGSQAGGGDVVAEDSAIHNLREEGGLRDEFAHQVRDVFLTLRSEGFLVAGAAAEGDDDHFSLAACRGRRGAVRGAVDRPGTAAGRGPFRRCERKPGQDDSKRRQDRN